MKKLYFIILFFLAVGVAQAQPFRGNVTVTREVLAEEGDSLHVAMHIRIQGLAMNKTQSWTIIPFITAGNNSRELPKILVNGNNKRQMYERGRRFRKTAWLAREPHYAVVNVNKATNTILNYSVSIPYEMWMDDASLALRQILTSCADQQQLFTVVTGGSVVLEPRTPYEVQPRVAFITPEREMKTRNIQEQAFLDFQVGSSVIIPTFRRNPEELAKIGSAINRVRDNRDVEITSLFIEGYASPEGSYDMNHRLALDRATALKNHIHTHYGIPLEKFRVTAVGEDWEGLRVLVEASNMAYRDQVLAIIDSGDNPDRKEQRLRALGGGAPFRHMLNEMFPPLRRADYQINFTVRDYSIEEARVVMGRNPEHLSQLELFQIAQTYPQGSTQFNEIFDLTLRMFPDDKTANNNAAAVMLLRNEDNTARRYLERAGESGAALNNMGVIYLRAGDLDTAELYFNRAAATGMAEAQHNLNEVRLKREDNLKMKRFQNR